MRRSRILNSMKAASVHDVAEAIRARLLDVDEMKLHKLLYFCQGHHLADLGTPLFRDDIEAWRYGPVVRSIRVAEHHDSPWPETRADLTVSQLNTIGYVLSRYGTNSAGDLSDITHAEGPWRDTWRRRIIGRRVITTGAIREHFLKVAAADAKETGVQFARADVHAFLVGAHARAAEPSKVDDVAALIARAGRD